MKTHPHPLARHPVGLALDVAGKDRHQAQHLFGRALPVLGREGIKREPPDAQVGGGGHELLHPLGGRAMAHKGAAARARWAQRPFPSMMMATWSAVPGALIWSPRHGRRSLPCLVLPSDLHDLGLLALERLVDQLDEAVGQCLNLILPEGGVILRQALGLAFFTWSIPSRRRLRIATRACSAYCAATLVSSRRRCSFSSGMAA